MPTAGWHARPAEGAGRLRSLPPHASSSCCAHRVCRLPWGWLRLSFPLPLLKTFSTNGGSTGQAKIEAVSRRLAGVAFRFPKPALVWSHLESCERRLSRRALRALSSPLRPPPRPGHRTAPRWHERGNCSTATVHLKSTKHQFTKNPLKI